ncbi:MAG: hypothetical protein R2844_13855 [Caldilineales bacterium]
MFHQARVNAVDLAGKQVQLDGMEPLAYDYLVVGLGAVVNTFGVPGADDHAFRSTPCAMRCGTSTTCSRRWKPWTRTRR